MFELRFFERSIIISPEVKRRPTAHEPPYVERRLVLGLEVGFTSVAGAFTTPLSDEDFAALPRGALRLQQVTAEDGRVDVLLTTIPLYVRRAYGEMGVPISENFLPAADHVARVVETVLDRILSRHPARRLAVTRK